MPSTLLIVFIVQVVIYYVNTVDISVFWGVWKKIPSISNSFAEYEKLKAEILKVRKDLNAISSQDEFAKWAKLRRHHDKVLEKLEKAKNSMDSTKSSFESAVKIIRWFGTNGFKMILQFCYQKQPMIYIPTGWVPYYVEWMLSFPRAPLGSVSIQNWSFSCTAIILLVTEVITTIMVSACKINSVGTVNKDFTPNIYSGSKGKVKAS